VVEQGRSVLRLVGSPDQLGALVSGLTSTYADANQNETHRQEDR
jgi:hypothetical protein